MPPVLRSMGGKLDGARFERARLSPHFMDGKFRNAVPQRQLSRRESREQLKRWLFGTEQRVPSHPVPVVVRQKSDYKFPPSSGLRITWLGHSTALIEIDGYRILTDPVWSERASPATWAGPRRLHPAPMPLSELPPIDAVVISHDHYDHLDMPTVRTLAARGTRFIVPLGIGAHLERWGIPFALFSELDWGDQVSIGDLVIRSTPARHYSGRNPLRMNMTLWASWMVQGPQHRLFFSGDTGYTPDFKSIGDTFGPFDATLIKIGASDPSWSEIHMTPEEAVQTHRDLRGGVMLPVHWCTFNLAFHAWSEPVERTVAAAQSVGVSLAVPRPGEFVEPRQPPAIDFWWRAVQ